MLLVYRRKQVTTLVARNEIPHVTLEAQTIPRMSGLRDIAGEQVFQVRA